MRNGNENEKQKHPHKQLAENEILNYKNYQINLNKLNTIHIYSNFVAVIFMLKYLDMIMIVKKGGKHF